MDDEGREPTQKTPTGHEIPVPKKADVLKDFKKVSKPKPHDEPKPRGQD